MVQHIHLANFSSGVIAAPVSFIDTPRSMSLRETAAKSINSFVSMSQENESRKLFLLQPLEGSQGETSSTPPVERDEDQSISGIFIVLFVLATIVGISIVLLLCLNVRDKIVQRSGVIDEENDNVEGVNGHDLSTQRAARRNWYKKFLLPYSTVRAYM